MKKLFLFVCAFAAGILCAEEYKIDFGAAKPWGFIRHYDKRTVDKTQEINGKRATVISNVIKDPKKTDTAFGLETQIFPVAGKKQIIVSASVLNPEGLSNFTGKGADYSPSVRFYDGKNREVKPFARFTLPKGTGEFQAVKAVIPVPEKAAKAQIIFGYDEPNIGKNQIFAIADVKWSTK